MKTTRVFDKSFHSENRQITSKWKTQQPTVSLSTEYETYSEQQNRCNKEFAYAYSLLNSRVTQKKIAIIKKIIYDMSFEKNFDKRNQLSFEVLSIRINNYEGTQQGRLALYHSYLSEYNNDFRKIPGKILLPLARMLQVDDDNFSLVKKIFLHCWEVQKQDKVPVTSRQKRYDEKLKVALSFQSFLSESDDWNDRDLGVKILEELLVILVAVGCIKYKTPGSCLIFTALSQAYMKRGDDGDITSALKILDEIPQEYGNYKDSVNFMYAQLCLKSGNYKEWLKAKQILLSLLEKPEHELMHLCRQDVEMTLLSFYTKFATINEINSNIVVANQLLVDKDYYEHEKFVCRIYFAKLLQQKGRYQDQQQVIEILTTLLSSGRCSPTNKVEKYFQILKILSDAYIELGDIDQIKNIMIDMQKLQESQYFSSFPQNNLAKMELDLLLIKLNIILFRAGVVEKVIWKEAILSAYEILKNHSEVTDEMVSLGCEMAIILILHPTTVKFQDDNCQLALEILNYLREKINEQANNSGVSLLVEMLNLEIYTKFPSAENNQKAQESVICIRKLINQSAGQVSDLLSFELMNCTLLCNIGGQENIDLAVQNCEILRKEYIHDQHLSGHKQLDLIFYRALTLQNSVINAQIMLAEMKRCYADITDDVIIDMDCEYSLLLNGFVANRIISLADYQLFTTKKLNSYINYCQQLLTHKLSKKESLIINLNYIQLLQLRNSSNDLVESKTIILKLLNHDNSVNINKYLLENLYKVSCKMQDYETMYSSLVFIEQLMKKTIKSEDVNELYVLYQMMIDELKKAQYKTIHIAEFIGKDPLTIFSFQVTKALNCKSNDIAQDYNNLQDVINAFSLIVPNSSEDLAPIINVFKMFCSKYINSEKSCIIKSLFIEFLAKFPQFVICQQQGEEAIFHIREVINQTPDDPCDCILPESAYFHLLSNKSIAT